MRHQCHSLQLAAHPTASHWLEEWFIAAQLLFMRMCVQRRLHCMPWTVVGLSGKSSSAIQLIYNKHSTNSISVNYPEICPVVEMSGNNSHQRSRATAGSYPSTPYLCPLICQNQPAIKTGWVSIASGVQPRTQRSCRAENERFITRAAEQGEQRTNCHLLSFHSQRGADPSKAIRMAKHN